MAPKKTKGKKDLIRKKALKEYIELGAEFAVNKREIERLTKRNNEELAPELRKLAKKAGLHKTKDKPEVTGDLVLETRFNTTEKYDTERLHKWLKHKGLDKVIKKCFTFEKVTKFDKAMFDKLDEAGEIPEVDELEEGDDPIYWVEEQTPSLYVHDSEAAKEAEQAAKDKKKRRTKK